MCFLHGTLLLYRSPAEQIHLVNVRSSCSFLLGMASISRSVVACDLDAFKLLALYDRDLAVSAINNVLGLHASVSRSITGSLPPLRDLLVSGSPLPWAAPACAGPMLTLMYRQLALRHTSADDFEAGVSLALLHIDGKYLKDVQPNMKNAALRLCRLC